MAGPDYGLTVNFDNGIESIYFSYGSTSYTFSTSGELYLFSFEPGNDINLTVTLKSSYSLDNSTLGTISGNTIVIPENEISSIMDCTITSKPSTPRKSVDLTTLPGWSSLSSGSHNITIVAKANGFKDSAPSAAVQVENVTEDALAGTWVFNDDCPNLLERPVSFTFNFMAKEEPVSTLVIDPSSAVTPADILFLYYDDIEVADSTGELAGIPTWIDDAFKTINITSKLSEVTNGEQLLVWLQANATKQS